MQTTNLTHFARLSLALLVLSASPSNTIYAAIDLNYDAINEDFGPYSNSPAQEAQEKLTQLGDWDASVQSLDDAISKFYARTNLPPANDIVQRLLDISMVESAEREARRVLNENSSEQMQAYAYTIAPWLAPANPMLAARSTLTDAVTSLNNSLKQLSDTVGLLY